MLIVFGARLRCEYCGRRQFHWWLPRPVRWALAVFLVACAYVASAAAVGWAKKQNRHSIQESTRTRLKEWVYPPLITLVRKTSLDAKLTSNPYFGWLIDDGKDSDGADSTTDDDATDLAKSKDSTMTQ